MVEREVTWKDGTVHTYWIVDPTFEPRIPPGTVRAHPSRHRPTYGMPVFYYQDHEKVCVQCRQHFVFRAKEQRYWYEVLQFTLDSVAIRCVRCRKQRRSRKALERALQSAVEGLREGPEDPARLLQLAEATVAFASRTGCGDLDRAISAARKAYRQGPGQPEALYWEGRCQDLAGRRAKARECMRAFVAEAKGRPGFHKLVRAAEKRLAPGKK